MKHLVPFRFPPTIGGNLTVLILCMTGALTLTGIASQQGVMTIQGTILVALLAAIAAVIATVLYQERRSRVLLRDLQSAIRRIAPNYAQITAGRSPATGSEGLENEIRMLAEQWTEFCHHCQNVYDSQLLHAEHLATVGELAAGLAHEIRNPLAGIAGVIETLAKDFPKNHPDSEIMGSLNQEVRRIEKTLNELLAYARPKPPQLAPCDIEETIARTLRMARHQMGARKVEFAVQVSPQNLTFPADAEQLHEVLLNLVLNAVQSIEGTGKISVEVEVRNSSQPNIPSQVEIAVADTGQGIAPNQIGDIFRPFYTTKRGGTGLGLSLSRRIITGHGGTLVAESEPDKGSRFTIRLPLGSPAQGLTQITPLRQALVTESTGVESTRGTTDPL
jgi:signal transduction histidine kinase